jgi:hypothetical protein
MAQPEETPRQKRARIYTCTLGFRLSRAYSQVGIHTYDLKLLTTENEYHISQIISTDVLWGNAVINFIANNTEFISYTCKIPVSKQGSINVNKLGLKTANQVLLYWLCSYNVSDELCNSRYKYACKDMYTKLPLSLMVHAEAIRKLPEIKTVSELETAVIPIYSQQAKAYVKMNFFNDGKTIDITDKHFLAGMRSVYNLHQLPTPEQAQKIMADWEGDKYVGFHSCVNIGIQGIF